MELRLFFLPNLPGATFIPVSKDMMDGEPLSGRLLDSAQFLRGGCGVSKKESLEHSNKNYKYASLFSKLGLNHSCCVIRM